MNRMRAFRRALRSSVGRACAYQIRDGWGASISGMLERVIRGERVTDAEISETLAFDEDEDRPLPQRVAASAGPIVVPGAGPGNATALVPVHGVAMYDVEWQPYCFSTLALAQTMQALGNDPEIGTIVLDINSPGGMVTGTAEAGDAIFAAREKKKVVAIVNPLAASAAYWIAAQASQIVAIPSADIGSIGVFMLHAECSGAMEQAGIKPTFIFAGEHKVEGNAFEPLSEDARSYMQMEVDTIFGDFLKAVARGRGVSVEEVRAKFGQGRTMMAPAAKRVGMIDAIAPLDSALSRFGITMMPAQGRRRGEDDAPELTAGDPSPETDPPASPAATEPAPVPHQEEGDDEDTRGRKSGSRARRLALLSA